jgi:hypothetical protein
MSSGYFLVFEPHERPMTDSESELQAWNEQWRIELAANPDYSLMYVEQALVAFQARAGVDDWRDVARSYRIERPEERLWG